ncbi:MAG: aspartate/glutamate racemase family protein, partial [Verrucomicrobia bacterium]|nr:aspartate/glutamate racemase family protein [Verrucomicrobiota bacterium]
MKTIGLIGGMSWVSTLDYYRLLNEEVQRRLGGLHSARVILNSLDFAPLAEAQKTGEWDKVADILTNAAMALETAGAELLLIGTNTMHRVADTIQTRIRIPLVHIADVVGDATRDAGLQRVGLLGTRATMEQDFYAQRLAAKRLQILTPPATERERLDRLIFEELCRGVVTEAGRNLVLSLIRGLQQRGAQGVILGCTELGGVAPQ